MFSLQNYIVHGSSPRKWGGRENMYLADEPRKWMLLKYGLSPGFDYADCIYCIVPVSHPYLLKAWDTLIFNNICFIGPSPRYMLCLTTSVEKNTTYIYFI